jgi:hypothetical protein
MRADGVAKSFAGQTGVWAECGALFGFAAVTMSLGPYRLKWREH